MKRRRLNTARPKMVPGFKRLTDNVLLSRTRISNSTFIDHPENFHVSNNVFIGHHNFIEASNKITIEEGCQLTNFITVTSHSSHNAIRIYGDHYGGGKKMKGYVAGPVEIGKYSFIGPHVTIMPNTKIGKGSLVSAYSYVQGEFPDFSIIAGNPATVVGSTKTTDERILTQNPELTDFYEEWSKS